MGVIPCQYRHKWYIAKKGLTYILYTKWNKWLIIALNKTTRECVHLVISEVTFGHVTIKDGGYTIRSAVVENTMLHAKFMAILCFIEPELLPIEVLHCRNMDFLSLLLLRPCYPMTFIIRSWPVFPRNIPGVRIWTFYIRESFRKLSSDRHTRQRDSGTDIPRRLAGGLLIKQLGLLVTKWVKNWQSPKWNSTLHGQSIRPIASNIQ